LQIRRGQEYPKSKSIKKGRISKEAKKEAFVSVLAFQTLSDRSLETPLSVIKNEVFVADFANLIPSFKNKRHLSHGVLDECIYHFFPFYQFDSFFYQLKDILWGLNLSLYVVLQSCGGL